jgi:hypothetical protein
MISTALPDDLHARKILRLPMMILPMPTSRFRIASPRRGDFAAFDGK